jgi:5-methylcytosine-specific restriction endonuclease McrA
MNETREWLQSQLGYCGPPNTPEWQDLLSKHPTWGTRLAEIQRVRVRRSRLNGSVQLQINLNGTRFYTISWHACVKMPTNCTVSAVLREAIQYQMRAWRSAQLMPLRCKECGASSSIEVDHIVPLKQLICDFAVQNAILTPTPDTWLYNKRTHGRKLPSGRFKTAWQRYHLQHATFQLLCKSCNAHKGASV